jgi:predicted ATPase/GAF domain-containing protein
LGEALQIASLTVAALDSLHARGFVHCDVTPRNLLYDDQGRSIYFLDCSCMRGSGTSPRANSSHPTPYVAPEQTLNELVEIDVRADLYAVGVILHQLVSGELPLEHADLAAVRPEVIPRGLIPILSALLAVDREDRYATAAAVKKDLVRCLEDWRSDGVLLDLPPSLGHGLKAVRFPHDLVGRHAIRGALHDCLIDAGRGLPTLVLVTAAGGAGKSTILADLRGKARGEGALVLSGGWSPYDRNVPLHGLVPVCDQIAEWLSTLGREERDRVRRDVRQALGDGCGILTESFPMLDAVFGSHPSPRAGGTIERRNRLTHCFASLLGALGSPERPVLLLLEDLQWADAGSLPIIERLPGRAARLNLLTVASVRTGDDGAKDGFVAELAQAAEERGQTVRTLVVPPFELADTRTFLARALGVVPVDVEPLAAPLTEISLGNPLALREILASATAQGTIRFDHEAERWTWNVEEIRRCHLPDGVAQILANRLSSMAPDALSALRAAACVGARFDVAGVAELLGHPTKMVRAALEACVAMGFVLPVGVDASNGGDPVYVFRHERVQSAAYGGLSPAQQQRLHASRGAALLAAHEAAGSPGTLFEALTHLNRSYALHGQGGNDLALARLNVKGATMAHHATAYDTAAQLLDHASAQLPTEIWECEPSLAFEAALLHAECEYLSKRTPSAERAYAAVLARELSTHQRLTTLMTRMRMLSTMGRFEESAADGLACLHLLGLEMRLDARPSHVIRPMLRAMTLNRRLPVEPDQVTIASCDLATSTTLACLADLWGPAFWINENLTGLVVFALVRLSLTRGNTAASAIGYASYGIFLANVLKRERLGKKVCALGVAVAEKAQDPVYIGRARFMYEAFFGHLEQPLRGAPATFRNLVSTSLRAGDYPYAGAAANMFLYYLPVVGTPLSDFLPAASEIVGVARQTEQSRTIMTVEILRRWIEILEGRAEHTVPRFSADNAFIEGKLNESERGLYHLFEISLFYFLEDYEGAVPYIDSLPGNKMLNGYFAVYYAFFAALVLARRGQQAGLKYRWRPHFRRHLRVVVKHARRCPQNYGHMALLLRAIDAAARNQDRQAGSLLQEAINDAREQGFLQNAAIAAEWLAECLDRRGDLAGAGRSLGNARLWYHQWGCLVKAVALDKLLAHRNASSRVSTEGPSPPDERWPSNAASVLDVARALSGETDPSRLADRLMVSLVKHTRATRGVLLIREESELAVACERNAPVSSLETLVVPGGESLGRASGSPDLPSLIVNYVDRLGRPVRLTASKEHELFGRDPYMGAHPRAGLLCVPLVHMRQSVGVLFLEKENHGAGFGPADLVVAEILAAQAAATLSNQREYNERLAALQNQMHPHFLFNALSGIAELTVKDPLHAERAILNLAALYRNILVSSRQPEITLREELDLVEAYLALEKLRFGARLSYRFDVHGDPATALVPPLMVQPLVENSVNHGIALSSEGGTVNVEVTVTERRVHVRVSDDGAGWNAGGSGRGAGLGLQSIRRRLQLFFGNDADLSVSTGAPVTVDLFFPLRPSQPAKPGDAARPKLVSPRGVAVEPPSPP